MRDKTPAQPAHISGFKSCTYQLVEKIGEGGFGRVYKAIHLKTKQFVAIKLLTLNPNFDLEKRTRHIERFERETLLGSRLHHPNIVGLLDKGQCDNGLIYAVFEFVDGQSLKDRLIDAGALPPLDAADIMAQVLDALAYAHQQGVIHRDIKPANIILKKIGAKTYAKILDFGIGAFVHGFRELDYKSITLTQESLGTPSYSAPEQLRGEPPTPKSDLYVWGLVFIECLTGRPAISGTNLASIFHKQLNQSNVPLPAAIAGHPVAALLRRVLHKKADERTASAADIYNQLTQLNFASLVGSLATTPANYLPEKNAITAESDLGNTLINDNKIRYTGLTERKQITVICISLTIKTITQNNIDHEVIEALHRDQKSQCYDIAIRYGGFHVGSLGDSLLFYFGYPAVSDNDCRLCARAALDIISNLNKKNALLQHTQGIIASAHIGIHTGLATTYADSAPEGDTPNIAIELARTALPNQILCSDSTKKILDNYIKFKASQVKALGVKAKKTPLYLMTGERHAEAYGFLRASGQHNQLIGREGELTELLHLLEPTNQSDQTTGKNKYAHIHGEAGIGKSRLVIELRSRAQTFNHIITQCLPEYKNSALYPILTVLKYKYSLDTLPPETALAQLRSALYKRQNANIKQGIPILCAWLTLPLPNDLEPVTDSPADQKHVLFDMLSSLLLHQDDPEPRRNNLFMFEDIHWADPTTIEFIAHLISHSNFREPQHVFISTSRQTLPESLVSIAIKSFKVPKLTEDKVHQFIRSLFDQQNIAHAILDVVTTRTDGIPLFIEELVTMLKQRNLVQRLNGIISLTNPTTISEVPNSLRESLHQNLDNLRYAKETAQLAATIGRKFDYDLLVSTSQKTEAQLQNDLTELLESELIYRQRNVESDSYIFKHALVRDAAYDSMIPSDKKLKHRQIATALARLDQHHKHSNPGILAMHWGAAEIYDKAIDCGSNAANASLKRSAASEAIAHAENVLSWINHLDKNKQVNPKLEIYGLLTSAFMETKGWASQEVLKYSEKSLNLLKTNRRYDELIPQLWWKVLNGIVGGRRQTLNKIVQEMDTLLHLANTTGKSAIKCAQGFYYFTEGNRKACIEAFQASIELYDTKDNKSHQQTYGFDVNVFAKATIARAFADQSLKTDAIKYSKLAVEEAKTYEHIPSIGIALMYYGLVHQQFQNKQAVNNASMELIAISEKHRLPIYQKFGQMLYDWSIDSTNRANILLDELQQAGSLHGLGHFQSFYADTYAKQNNYQKALAKIDECLALDRSINEANYQAYLLFKKAQYMELAHGAESALSGYNKAYKLAKQQGVTFITNQVETTKHQLLIIE